MLTLAIFLPIAGALAIILLPKEEEHRAKVIAAAVSADAPSVAESSRDVSNPTFGTGTLTPGSARGSLHVAAV